MDDMINNGAGLYKGIDIGKGDSPELAEERGVGTSNGSGSDKGPANCTGLQDGPSDGMFA